MVQDSVGEGWRNPMGWFCSPALGLVLQGLWWHLGGVEDIWKPVLLSCWSSLGGSNNLRMTLGDLVVFALLCIWVSPGSGWPCGRAEYGVMQEAHPYRSSFASAFFQLCGLHANMQSLA